MANYNIDAIYNGSTSLPGTERIRIDGSGNVGINQSSPAYKLDVNGTARIANDMLATGNITIGKAAAYLILDGTNSDAEIYWRANSSNRWAAGMNVGDATENFNIYNYTTATTNFTILKANGNVGIGSTAPNDKLDVVGRVYAYRYIAVSSNASSPAYATDTSTGMFNAGTNIIGFSISGTEKLRIDSNGNVGIGAANPINKLVLYDTKDTSGWNTNSAGNVVSFQINNYVSTVNTPAVIELVQNDHASVRLAGYKVDNTSYWLSNFGISVRKADTNMHQVFTAKYDGNIGIGTTSPAVKLDVIGSIRYSSNGNPVTEYAGIIMTPDDYPTCTEKARIYTIGTINANGNNSSYLEVEVIGSHRGYTVESYYEYKRWIITVGDRISSRLVFSSGRDLVGLWNGTDATGFKGQNGAPDLANGAVIKLIANPNCGAGLFYTVKVKYADLNLTQGPFTYTNHSVYSVTIPSSQYHLYGDTVILGVNSGNVGIGTSSPTNKLHIYSSANEPVLIQGTTGGTWLNFQSSTSNLLSIGADSTRGIGFYNRTTSADLMTISNGGNVGIGTNIPVTKLHVEQVQNAESLITLRNNRQDLADVPIFGISAQNSVTDVAKISFYRGGGGNSGYLTFSTKFDNAASLTEKVRIDGAGNVGIGTTSPSSTKLHVVADWVSGHSTIKVQGITDNTTGYGFYNTSGARMGYVAYVGSAFEWYNNEAIPIIFYTSGLERMRVLSGGNVGIGTTVSAEKLSVEGSIILAASDGTSLGSGRKLRFYRPSDGWEPAQIEQIWTGGGYQGVLAFKTNTGALGTLTTKMVINNDGNVGIGTTSPRVLLDLAKANNVGQVILIGETSTNIRTGFGLDSSTAGMRIFCPNLNSEAIYIGGISTSDGTTFTRNHSFGVGGKNSWLNEQGGNVGIGTTSPAYKLEVIGDARVSGGIVNGGLSAQWTLSGGGTVTFNGYITWSNRVIAIPVERIEFGADGYIDITCPTSGTITYYNSSNITTTVTCDANGIPIASWESLYYEVTPGQSAGSDQTKFRLVNYNNTTWRPSSNWLLICTRNGDGNFIKWIPGQVIIPIGGSFDSSNSTNNWQIAGTTNYVPKFAAANKIGNSAIYDSSGNIGIGTTSPFGTAANRTVLSVNGTTDVSLNIGSGGSQRAYLYGVSTYAELGTIGGLPLRFAPNNSEKMRINVDGNVGIGTSNPISLLQIAGTTSMFPTYDSITGYSYFLRMGYDTSGSYDYTIKRNGTTGFLEFNGTQGSPYVSYVFAGGDVYSGASGGTVGGFYFNSSSHGIRRATGTNDVYCFTTSGTLYLGAGGSSTTHVRVLSGGDVGIGVSPSYKLDVNGNIHGTGFPTSSDVRFKKNITPLQNSLEKIKKLQGVKYEWNEFVNSRRDGYKLNIPIIGLIAQDVEQVVPEIVDHWKLSDDCQDARSIDYPRLIPLLIEAIKEQQNQIEELRNEIKSLKSN